MLSPVGFRFSALLYNSIIMVHSYDNSAIFLVGVLLCCVIDATLLLAIISDWRWRAVVRQASWISVAYIT